MNFSSRVNGGGINGGDIDLSNLREYLAHAFVPEFATSVASAINGDSRMLERIRAINNPLTIIALFAALAEVAGTVSLVSLDKTLQQTFLWFVMGFPILLVLLFFIILIFRPRVLYGPSDYKDEKNFMSMSGATNLSRSFSALRKSIEATKAEMTKAIATNSSTEPERVQLKKMIEQFTQIQNQVVSTEGSAEQMMMLLEGQIKQLEISTRGETYGDLYRHQQVIHQFFIERLDLRPFFYDGAEVKGDEVEIQTIKIVAEMMVDFFEHIFLQLPSLGEDTQEGWESYIVKIYRNSPAVREHIKTNGAWYSRRIKLLETEDQERQGKI